VKQIKFKEDLRAKITKSTGGFCQIEKCVNEATELHHITPNTKVNQKKFPLYLQSPFNCFPICNDCHMTKPLPNKPTEAMVILFEEYLTLLSK
jgi:hypothetical protein